MSMLVTKPPIVASPPSRQSFATLTLAHQYAQGVINSGILVQISRLREDFFKSVLPRDQVFKILGVAAATEKICKRLEPTGEWRIEVEEPGTEYTEAGIFGARVRTTKYYRFSAWYSRFLPYALAMLRAEEGFKHIGINYESVNAYYGTCFGFHYIGECIDHGHEDASPGKPEYNRIEPEDAELYRECYYTSCKVSPPDLPFSEVHQPCMVYVALKRPQEITKIVDPNHWWCKHIAACCEEMRKPIPPFKKR